MPAIAELASPNFDARPKGQAIDMLLIHYTGMNSRDGAIQRLRDPDSKVSAHYVVDEEGAIFRLVKEHERAWHAGVSRWQGASDINARSIGIELVNPGHEFGYRPYPARQMASLVALAQDIVARHAIPGARVLGHSDVAPMRKLDPGELFDWRGLAEAGVGLWPQPRRAPWQEADFATDLARYGYDIEGPAGTDPKAAREAAILAFCRHFRAGVLATRPDGELAAILNGLIDVDRQRT